MTFTLLRANRDLMDMGKMFGGDISQIETWISILEEGAATLWNDDIKGYDSRDAHTGNSMEFYQMHPLCVGMLVLILQKHAQLWNVCSLRRNMGWQALTLKPKVLNLYVTGVDQPCLS